MDYDDVLRMRQLCEKYTDIMQHKNQELELLTNNEIILDTGIMKHNITEKVSWKKQCILLMRQDNSFITPYKIYMRARELVKAYENLAKSVEAEINCLKKIYSVTPQP